MGRSNQSSAEPETKNLGTEDETLGTNRAATVVPLSVGEAKTAIRWITPIYGQRVVKESRTNSDKSK
jgi:hypothetical protein